MEKYFLLQGVSIAKQLRNIESVEYLSDVEFSVFSQWGEDGIIEWLIQKNGSMPEIFIEFGVEDFRESNCRFLLMHRNWRGLVIDGSKSNIDAIQSDNISWRHDLTSRCAFITKENINELITTSGIVGEIGILSIDIDGNDFWVWESISSISPQIVIVEYNSVFGDMLPLSIPYIGDFVRSRADQSNVYYGASIRAFSLLAKRKGYTLLGGNLAGSNAFFIRNDRLHLYEGLIKNKIVRPSRFKESRDKNNNLNFKRGAERLSAISDKIVINIDSGEEKSISNFGELSSKNWVAAIEGGSIV